MKNSLGLIAITMALAACGKSPQVDAKNASVAEVAQKVHDASAGGTMVNPGKWQSKVTIDEFDMPGMPPQLAQRMKSTMAQYQKRTIETCLTKEEAKRPKEDFFAGKNNSCRYDHFTMGNGKIDAKMRCSGPGGASQLMTMAGTYSPEAYEMSMSIAREGGPESSAGMTMKTHIEAHRVGECTGDEIDAKEHAVGK